MSSTTAAQFGKDDGIAERSHHRQTDSEREAGATATGLAEGEQREAPSRRAEHWRAIWSAVTKIPRGHVASYGEVALAAGLPGRARMVGRALSGLPPNSRVPWHRVVNASGRISLGGEDAERQARLLRREGVEIGPTGRIDLRRFRV